MTLLEYYFLFCTLFVIAIIAYDSRKVRPKSKIDFNAILYLSIYFLFLIIGITGNLICKGVYAIYQLL